MSYDARVFNVMIASPSDVASERSKIREVIYEWNAIHSKERRMVLLPVGWESHSSPEMGDRPQALINEQTLDKCDLLVGIFGTRIGSETGKYISGTVEEIEKAIKSRKLVMIYFAKKKQKKKQKQNGNSDTQSAKLEAFKKDCERRGLYETYAGDSDFKNKLSRQLASKVNEHEIFQFQAEEIDVGIETEESADDILQHLSDTAKTLLHEASRSTDGEVYLMKFDEIIIQVNDKNIIPDQNPRVVAKWTAALKELENAGLLEVIYHDVQRGHRTFRITHYGYQIADRIGGSTS